MFAMSIGKGSVAQAKKREKQGEIAPQAEAQVAGGSSLFSTFS